MVSKGSIFHFVLIIILCVLISTYHLGVTNILEEQREKMGVCREAGGHPIESPPYETYILCMFFIEDNKVITYIINKKENGEYYIICWDRHCYDSKHYHILEEQGVYN